MEEEQNSNGKSDQESSEGGLLVLLKVFLYLSDCAARSVDFCREMDLPHLAEAKRPEGEES